MDALDQTTDSRSGKDLNVGKGILGSVSKSL